MRRIGAALVIAVALAAGAAGCGGSDDGDEGGLATSSLSKAQFVKKANKVCEEQTSKRNAALLKGSREEAGKSGKLTKAGEENVAKSTIPPMRKLVAELEELGAPEQGKEQMETLIATIDEGNDEIEAHPQNALQGRDPYEAVTRLAYNYGLVKCAQI